MGYQIIKGAIASNGDRDDIPKNQSAITNQMSYSEGFPTITSDSKLIGGLPPRRRDINEVFYLITSNLFELQSGKYPTFNADVLPFLPNNGYPLNAILWSDAEQRFLRSTKADNASNFITNPETIGTDWQYLDYDKANVSLNNISDPSQSFKEMSVGWGMPDYSAGVVAHSMGYSTTNTFTAQFDGYIYISAYLWSNSSYYITINGIKVDEYKGEWGGETSQCFNFVGIVKRGDIIKTYYEDSNTNSQNKSVRFFPLKGAN